MVVHVADLLKLPSFKLAHTRAGVRGLNREVEYIDVLKSPDMEMLVKPRVLYLTSGFIFQDNGLLQEKVISRLADTGAAGLVFEQGRYLSSLPSVMLEEANRTCFPIMELPWGAVFADIIREGLKMIFARQGAALRRSQEIQKRLTEVAATGGNLSQIAQTLANLVSNTVIIADDKFSLLSFAFWEKGTNKHKRKAYVGNTLDQYLYNLEKTGFIDKIRQEKKPGRVEVLFSKQGEQAWVVVPVLINGDNLGYIAVLEDYHKLEKEDWEALEQASGVTAVSIYKKVAEEEVLRRQRNDLLLRILQKHVPVGTEVLEQASHLGMFFDNKMALLQIAFVNLEEYCGHHFSDCQDECDRMRTKLLDMIVAQLATRQKKLLIACYNEQITVVCPAEDWHSREQALKQIQQIKQEFRLLSPELACTVGVSQICENCQCLPEAYREAQEALTIGCRLAASDDVHFFSNLGVYQFLVKFQGMEELRDYYHSILGKMDKLDVSTRNDFLKTLEAYFSTNANIYKAAQSLYLHRNSMKYRLERIGEILEINLDEPEMRFNVQLALKIRHLL